MPLLVKLLGDVDEALPEVLVKLVNHAVGRVDVTLRDLPCGADEAHDGGGVEVGIVLKINSLRRLDRSVDLSVAQYHRVDVHLRPKVLMRHIRACRAVPAGFQYLPII